jgi:outer membrane protein assembly factor BamD (BamD/ComL family)
MTQNRGLTDLLLLAFSLAVISTGCVGGPWASSQVRAAAKDSSASDGYGEGSDSGGWLFPWLSGRKLGANETSRTPAQPQPNAAMSPTQPSDMANPGNSQPVVQTSALQPDPSASISGPSAVVSTVATPAIGEDNSREFPVSILPPQPTIVTPPPKILPDPPPTPSSYADPTKDKDEDFWAKLAPENVYKSIKKATGYGPNETIARADFKAGQDLFRQKKFSEAADKFKTAADHWPDTPLEEDALFMLAESQFFSDQYPKAHDAYAKLLKKYTNTRHLDWAVRREFAIGRYWEQLDDYQRKWPTTPNLTDKSRPLFDTFGYAVQAYQNVRMYDPAGPLADDSLMATAVAYFRRGQFESAAEDFDLLRREYPNSEFQKYAHILDLQAKMRVYQGKYYDPTALTEAGEIADQTMAQFGAQLGAEQARVVKAKRQILEEKANREFAMAQYYEKQKYYGAARYYYQGLIQAYPTTQRANDAREKLEALKGLPDEPPNRFKWLTDLFPSSKPK